MSWIDAQEWGLERLERLAAWLDAALGRVRGMAPHLATGLRGEREALFELRRRGYTIVGRRWKDGRVPGDLDLIGWQDGRLCFIEVKTRTARDAMPAESAVGQHKRRMVRRLARLYLQRFPDAERRTIPVRFDVVSVYRIAGVSEFEVFTGAYGWRR